MTSSSQYPKTLVTDFDGTLTRTDFFQAILDKYVDDKLAIWQKYCRGSITHFEALAEYYRQIRVSELEILTLIGELGFPSNFEKLVENLGEKSWQVVIASAGCEWYINKLIQNSKIKNAPVIHANKGRFSSASGLVMELPKSSPHYHPEIGISKSSVVKHHMGQNRTVAFAGDGPTDLPPALLVSPKLRFAKGALATLLSDQKEEFIPFENWEEIPNYLLRLSSE